MAMRRFGLTFQISRDLMALMSKDIRASLEQSRTSVTKLVFPNTTNHHGTLFGGTLMQWMDEVAFIACTRLLRQKVVTVSMDKIDFKTPLPEGTIVELVAKVVHVGTTSLGVRVQVFRENMYDDERELAVTGHLTFVAVSEQRKPIPLSIHGDD